MNLKELNTKTDTFIIGWVDDNADKYELVKVDRSPQTDEAKDSALPPGYVELPTVEQAGIIAAGLCEELEANEQAFFIAGFQECVKHSEAT